MSTLDTPISELPRIGKALTKNLNRLGIKAVSDLLFYFPYKHLDFSVYSDIKDIHADTTITIRGTVKTIASRYAFKSRLSLCEAIISDETGAVKVTWFNQPYIKNYLQSGDEVLISGKATFYKQLQFVNPIYEKVGEESIHTGRIVPVYHLTENVYNKTIRTLVKSQLGLVSELPETLPQTILDHYELLSLPEAVRQIHFPDSEETLHRAKLRISFDELFIEQLAVQKHRLELATAPTPSIRADVELVKRFLASLPFTLTTGQKQSAWQIMQELEGPQPMNRLVEGDVGSGKTLVALLSVLAAIKQGFQVALLAPTEILAKQHYQTFTDYLHNNKKFTELDTTSLALATNTYRLLNNQSIPKTSLAKKIEQGEVALTIGTHALLYNTSFENLGIIIVDEQHRFGVEQRARLLKQKSNSGLMPHLLSMTATPIPRTLALTLYSDLSLSTLKQLPGGRKPIETRVIPEDSRAKVYAFIKRELRAGRQAFIVTPRVEDTSAANTKSVKKEFERLSKQIFPEFRLGLLYGKMKGSDKDAVMGSFAQGELDILVATSVIEIGIDVPNATILVIEGAQSFGLAQLHQLRGRVGRGQQQSYCFLFSDSSDEHTLSRLMTFAHSTDGFKLAELDLQQRGFGDLFGSEQSGFHYKFSRFITLKTLQLAREAAKWLLKQDVTLSTHSALQTTVNQYIEKIHLE